MAARPPRGSPAARPAGAAPWSRGPRRSAGARGARRLAGRGLRQNRYAGAPSSSTMTMRRPSWSTWRSANFNEIGLETTLVATIRLPISALQREPRPVQRIRGVGAIGRLAQHIELAFDPGVIPAGRRTREIGIRRAMGAGTGRVVWLVMRQGVTLSLAGIVAGGLLGTMSAGLLGSLMGKVERPGPMTVQRQLLLPVVLPHLRMLPAIFRMIVLAVSGESGARGAPGREMAARWFALDRQEPWSGRRVSGGCAAPAGRPPRDALPAAPVRPAATCRVVAGADRSGCSRGRYVTVCNRLVGVDGTERKARYQERRKAGGSGTAGQRTGESRATTAER